MSSKFGFLSKLNFLQDLSSSFIAGLNPAIIHNLEKYMAIKKVHYLSAIEDLQGDYIEFGVFTGSSFCHSIRCVKSLVNINSSLLSTKFYGFDSFEGFGELISEDKHPFYEDTNFEANYKKVNSRVKKVAKGLSYKLIKGFFSETLKQGAKSYGIEKTRIIFIDSDTYSSAIDALLFALPTIQEGTYIILDDYFSYKGSQKHGVAKAFLEFSEKGNLTYRHILNYGMGGSVFIISNIR
jgi:O-methyltransferase